MGSDGSHVPTAPLLAERELTSQVLMGARYETFVRAMAAAAARGQFSSPPRVGSEPELEGLFLRVAPSLGGRVCVARAAGLSTDGSDAYPWLLDRVRPRVIVGPAGFNLTYEARAAGLTHLAVPRPRRFDDQARRAEAVATRVRSPRHLLRLLQDPPAPAPIRVRSHDDLADVVLEAWRVRPPTPLSLRP